MDPGGVSTNIWQNSAFDKPPLSYFIRNLYTPPSDGAAAVVHAATVPWILEHKAAADITRRWAGGSSGGLRRRKAAQTLPDLRVGLPHAACTESCITVQLLVWSMYVLLPATFADPSSSQASAAAPTPGPLARSFMRAACLPHQR